jgi:nickel/cobalt transporter (NiCoT) family protein
MLAEQTGAEHGPLAWLGEMNLEYVGYGIVVLFVAAWALSVAIWKYGRIEERWSAHVR